jgi:hypothetical protein
MSIAEEFIAHPRLPAAPRRAADAIGEGLSFGNEVEVVPIAHASQELVDGAELVVVGGPTQRHGMSRGKTQQAAVGAAHKPGSGLDLDPDAEGPGLRDWFDSLRPGKTNAAAFDTRIDAPAVITGRASKGISRQLRHHGFREITEPMSFLVTKDSNLAPGQQTSGRQWGGQLARMQLVSPRICVSREDFTDLAWPIGLSRPMRDGMSRAERETPQPVCA